MPDFFGDSIEQSLSEVIRRSLKRQGLRQQSGHVAPPGEDALLFWSGALQRRFDFMRRFLIKAAYHVLKPGGVFVWTDPPPDDLCLQSRGFFEPYAWQWQQWSPDRELKDVGFRDVKTHHVVDPMYMWTKVATK